MNKQYTFTLNISRTPSSKHGVLAYVHNGAIKRRLDGSSCWLEFRLISSKNGEVPLSTTNGFALSTAEFVKRLSGDASDDIIISVELGADFQDEWDTASYGSLTVSFNANDLSLGKESEYKGTATQYFHIDEALIQLHRGVMRPKIDPSILDGFEATASSQPNVVTGQQLHAKAAARKRKREAAAAARAASAANNASTPVAQETQETQEIQEIQETQVDIHDLLD